MQSMQKVQRYPPVLRSFFSHTYRLGNWDPTFSSLRLEAACDPCSTSKSFCDDSVATWIGSADSITELHVPADRVPALVLLLDAAKALNNGLSLIDDCLVYVKWT